VPRTPPPDERGVIWTPASPPKTALHELDRIAEFGTTAIRLTRVPSDTVAARADALGLSLYVDLPIEYVSASQLPHALARAAPALDRLQTLNRRHASITHVGLARAGDTTVPSTCKTLRRWTDRVHSWKESLHTYYVTPFTNTADRCAEAVDRVLLNLIGDPTPVKQWRQWQSTRPNVGLGAVGTWVRPTAGSGLRVPHSPERQARYLEKAVSQLVDSRSPSPPVLFIARWQDQSRPPLPSRRYGLHPRDAPPRPAARVVRGLYTGQQRTFAFPAGTPTSQGFSPLVLLGWGLVVLLGGIYAQNLFVRETVARYFGAPGFYRDALRDGRDLTPGVHGLLLIIVAGALGTTGASAARLAAPVPATEHVLSALPEGLHFLLAGNLEHPLAASLLASGGVLSLLLVWSLVLVLTARWGAPFSLAQGLALVVWPCWPSLLALPLALAAGPDAPLSPSLFGLLLVGGGSVLLIYVTGRVLFDYWTITDLPLWTLLPITLSSPLVLTLATGFAYTALHDLSLFFLWRLATLTF